MTSSIGNINAYSYGSTFSGGAGSKLYVPVSKTALLYSNFDHISGVAAKSGEPGVSITKIRILNSIIERLSAIKNEPAQLATDISDDQAQVLIEQYQKEIQAAVKQTPYLLSGAQPQAGVLFSIDA